MTKPAALLGACLLLLTTAGCSESADSSPTEEGSGVATAALGKPSESSHQVSYAMGLNLGRNLKSQEVDVDLAYLYRGIEDALGGAELLLSDEEIMAAMQGFRQEMQAKQVARVQEASERNRAEGAAFMLANKDRPEVVSLSSGVQYEVVQQGDGELPDATSRVSVHYRGSLIDGTQFDSSYDRGQPATFRLDAVIPGWSEGLQLMKVGSIWKLFIPGELAYGDNPPPQGPIGPNATLIFVVELLAIES